MAALNGDPGEVVVGYADAVLLERQDGGALLAKDVDCALGIGTRERVDGVGDVRLVAIWRSSSGTG
jgi:hypothetical protein